jgi:hypothetical protein
MELNEQQKAYARKRAYEDGFTHGCMDGDHNHQWSEERLAEREAKTPGFTEGYLAGLAASKAYHEEEDE